MTCVICNDVLKVPVKLECSHIFCSDCIKEWFLRKRICPVCRAPSDRFPEVVSQGIDFDFEAFDDDYDLTDSDDTSTNISNDISNDTSSPLDYPDDFYEVAPSIYLPPILPNHIIFNGLELDESVN